MKKVFLVVLILILSFGCTENGTGDAVKSLQKKIIEPTKNTVELTGDLEVIIVDDFENERSETLYYLNTGKERYELKSDKVIPFFGSTEEITVKGVLEEDKMLVDSLKRTSKRSVDPWPPILGVKKYVVVYLLDGNETDFNAVDFTDLTFDLSNDFFDEASYEQVNVSADYIATFLFDFSNCNVVEIRNYAIELVDPFVDFTEYDGLIMYHPKTPCTTYGGAASYSVIETGEGLITLGSIWMNNPDEHFYFNCPNSAVRVLIHEIGHTFGLGHALSLFCTIEGVETTLSYTCNAYEYGDCFDVMGSGIFNHYNLRHKVEALQWIDNENILETNSGTYFISALNTPLETGSIKGIKIPINWDIENLILVSSTGSEFPLSREGMPYTHYYVEYRTPYGIESLDNLERYGVFLRFGRDDMFQYYEGVPEEYHFSSTYLLDLHPDGDPFNDNPYLVEGETYYDEFNDMAVTVLDTNEDGALIDICRGINEEEVCNNGIDDDCDGLIDETECTTLFSSCGGEGNPVLLYDKFDGVDSGPVNRETFVGSFVSGIDGSAFQIYDENTYGRVEYEDIEGNNQWNSSNLIIDYWVKWDEPGFVGNAHYSDVLKLEGGNGYYKTRFYSPLNAPKPQNLVWYHPYAQDYSFDINAVQDWEYGQWHQIRQKYEAGKGGNFYIDQEEQTQYTIENHGAIQLDEQAKWVLGNGANRITIDEFMVCQQTTQKCGDIDNSGGTPGDISDLIYLVSWMFQDGPAPTHLWTANVDGATNQNETQSIDISDLVYLVSYMFQDGPPLLCAPINEEIKADTSGTTYDEAIIIINNTAGKTVIEKNQN